MPRAAIIMTTDSVQSARLLQLCSANLPVGGFSFSQGLEYAVELGWVNSALTLTEWLTTYFSTSVTRSDLPLLKAQYDAVQHADKTGFVHNDDWVSATRESEEILLAEQAMGKALRRLLRNLTDKPSGVAAQWTETVNSTCFISQFALASHLFGLSPELCLSGYMWTILDSQIAAGTKLIPLGQTDGQNLLFRLGKDINHYVEKGMNMPLTDVGLSMPSMAMASAWHEQQYSRLFRS